MKRELKEDIYNAYNWQRATDIVLSLGQVKKDSYQSPHASEDPAYYNTCKFIKKLMIASVTQNVVLSTCNTKRPLVANTSQAPEKCFSKCLAICPLNKSGCSIWVSWGLVSCTTTNYERTPLCMSSTINSIFKKCNFQLK